ncbi:MAG TPA: agmatinase [Syntrophorhabdaceae bacterium]|nr:agmatinase [Syntrophorhabdaceae bacterium]HOT42388.1 agmatinase [Syntrophorhabdaceae bacterium]HPC65671.1 agmatinase [Syntrophorhabdaceae bacterium]HQE79751.1 agmatinase [Syntrophorhabdaceae bacterium]HQH43469.1 agmatinase [Syntrophorhabdaceae bacterium]
MKTIYDSRYIGSKDSMENADTVLIGCPLDATSSFRGGTRFAPDSVRKASWTLETYSPYMKMDLDELLFYDAGNLDIPQGNLIYSLEVIEGAMREIARKEKRPLIIGGEHLLTYPVIKGLKEVYSNIQVIHFDAHCDLRDEYEGQRLSHATVMKRVKELGISDIYQIGIRSGTRSEFGEAFIIDAPETLASQIRKQDAVYLTFDMDVFDPSLVPGVTTPEPGGIMFHDFIYYLKAISGMNIIGADIVELSPDYDTSFVSSICTAKVVREIIMLLSCRGG